jgi:RHS repeat-associated protein
MPWPSLSACERFFTFVLFTTFLLFTTQSFAQSLPMAPDARPFAPVEESAIDSFTVANDSILVSIPIWSIKERGQLSMDFTLRYTTPSFQETQDCLPKITPCNEEWDAVSSLYGVYLTSNLDVWMQVVPDVAGHPPVLTAWYWEVITPDSGTHKLALVSGTTNQYRSIDGTGWIFNAATCTATNQEGIQFVFSCAAPTQTTPYPVINHLSYVQDTNGNKIQMNYSGPTVLSSYMDTLGQTIAAPPISLASISFQNNVGGQATTDFTKCASTTTSAIIWTPPGTTNPIKFCYSPIRIQTNFFNGTGSPDVPTLPGGKPNWKIEAVSNQNFLSTVVMPNGMAWNFAYAGAGGNVNYGNLTSIGIATGGVLSYNWGESFVACGSVGNVHRGALGSRTLDAADGNGPQTWTYTYTYGNGNGVPPTAESTSDPMGNKINHTLTANNCSSYETEADYIDSKLGLLKTVTTQYEQLPTFYYLGASTATAAELPKTVTTTMLPGGSTSQTTYSYDAFSVMLQDWLDGATASVPYGVATTVTDSDVGSGSPGAVLRQTNTSYMALNGPNHVSYLANNLLTLPYTVQVTDGSGTQKGLTTYGYDESGYVVNSSSYNGNQTTIAKWLDTGGSISSHNHYDTNGMLTETDDPKTNPTKYTYQCSDALLQTVKNALNQVTTYGYDCNSRLLTSIQDPNDTLAGRPGTTFSYNSANDLQGITYPDLGSTTFNYNSYALPLKVTKTVTATPDPALVSSTTYDGVGRVSSSTAPNGAITTTTYDKDGRVNSTSNPHFSTPSPTDGTTLLASDALGRKTLQTQPDGSTQSWTYTGNSVNFKDEVGNLWKRTNDGLGRLIQVLEPSATSQSPSLETDYSYNTLDNLVGVNQIGTAGELARVRSFTYDSLSRLICAANSESSYAPCPASATTALPAGVESYSYDPNGNVSTKIDARAIGNIYAYDGLNRLTSKTPSNNTGASFFYNYDEQTVSWSPYAQTNTIGRLSSAWAVFQGIYSRYGYSYDARGRQLTKFFELPNSAGNAVNTSIGGSGNSYDLAGNVISFNNGLGVILSETRDGAGHVTAVTSNKFTTGTLNGVASHQLFANATYSPFGSPASRLLGNGLTENRIYDNRGRLLSSSQFQAGSSVGYNVAVTYFPNGNVQTSNDSVNGNWTYTFTPLNQLQTAKVASSSSTPLTLTWTYDSFGNRWTQTATGTGSAPQPSFSYLKANNHADPSGGFTYDNAGDVTKDNLGQTYAYYPDHSLASANALLGTAKYRYDAEGQLVFENGPNGSQVFLRSESGQPIVNDNLTSGYVVQGAYVDGEQIGSWQHDQFFWTGKDWLGTKRYETAGNGDIGSDAQPVAPASYTSLPFGDALSSIGNDPTHFTGKERDAESGLDYFGARYYGSSMGRWMSPDKPFADQHPANPQSWNLYSYVRNNPLSSIDTNGQVTIEVKYNPVAGGASNHSFIVITDRDGTQTVFRAGPTARAAAFSQSSGGSQSAGQLSGASGGSAFQSSIPDSSRSDSSNPSSPGAGLTPQGDPWGQLHAEQQSPTEPAGDNMSTITGSVTALSNDLPASSYIQGLQQFDTGLNQANIPYNPFSTNSNAYVTNALQSIGVPTPKAPVWAPGAGTDLHVTPPRPGQPTCSVTGTCPLPH